jgi:hypothetical protein
MTTWPDGWREALLDVAGIERSQFALDVLNLWAQATPIQGWTNNPLGMPAAGYGAPKAFNTPYAAFPTPDAFRKAFTKAVHAGTGKPLLSALATQDKLTVAWRAIHALNWPANLTETDYPATILDAVTDGSTAKMKVSKPNDRKSVGATTTRTDVHAMIQAQGQALHHAVSNISGATAGMDYVIGRMRNSG